MLYTIIIAVLSYAGIVTPLVGLFVFFFLVAPFGAELTRFRDLNSGFSIPLEDCFMCLTVSTGLCIASSLSVVSAAGVDCVSV